MSFMASENCWRSLLMRLPLVMSTRAITTISASPQTHPPIQHPAGKGPLGRSYWLETRAQASV